MEAFSKMLSEVGGMGGGGFGGGGAPPVLPPMGGGMGMGAPGGGSGFAAPPALPGMGAGMGGVDDMENLQAQVDDLGLQAERNMQQRAAMLAGNGGAGAGIGLGSLPPMPGDGNAVTPSAIQPAGSFLRDATPRADPRKQTMYNG